MTDGIGDVASAYGYESSAQPFSEALTGELVSCGPQFVELPSVGEGRQIRINPALVMLVAQEGTAAVEVVMLNGHVEAVDGDIDSVTAALTGESEAS